jgi:hypothetical protein
LEGILIEADKQEERLHSFEGFCATISCGIEKLTLEERRKILEILGIKEAVPEGQLLLMGAIPTNSQREGALYLSNI